MTDVHEFVKLALDPVRLAVLGASAQGPVDVGGVAEAMGVPVREVRSALGKLRTAGLVSDEDRLMRETLRRIAENLPQAPPPDPSIVAAGWSAEEADVLRRFFEGARLISIPTSRTKRLTVLERLVQEFEPGLRYREAEVNFTLQLFHADYAALRRYLVDEGFMTRADGVYWRTGGRYSTQPDGDQA